MDLGWKTLVGSKKPKRKVGVSTCIGPMTNFLSNSRTTASVELKGAAAFLRSFYCQLCDALEHLDCLVIGQAQLKIAPIGPKCGSPAAKLT